ncbi:hypothetical protein FRC03_004169, partial [Tulasnella sp. 419]
MKLSTGLATIAALFAAQGVSAIPEWGVLITVTAITGYSHCRKPASSSKRVSTTSALSSKTTSTSTKSTWTSSTPVLSSQTTSTSTTSTSASNTPTPSPTGRVKFKYYGVNQSCAEFGSSTIPGVLGTHYTWPTTDSIDFFLGKGFNTFRIAFLMERISPPTTGLTGPFDTAYLGDLKRTVSYITGKGGYAVLDPHNYLRYNGSVITDEAAFTIWWTNLATEFKSDPKVVFDINNEPHSIPASDAFKMNQVGVNAIRAAGATSQLILVEGTSWSGAWSWTGWSGNSEVYGAITDPYNNVAIEMHQYLDTDGSGTSDVCVSNTIGAERIADATAWLKANNLKGFLGEMGGGSNDVCIDAIKGALSAMQEPGTPWIGFLWWAAGPWWGNYFQSI